MLCISLTVLLLDEPLNGLDVNSVLTFRRILEGLAERGTAILYCSHILDVVERLCRRVIVLRNGEVIADAATAELVGKSSKGTLESVFRELTQHRRRSGSQCVSCGTRQDTGWPVRSATG